MIVPRIAFFSLFLIVSLTFTSCKDSTPYASEEAPPESNIAKKTKTAISNVKADLANMQALQVHQAAMLYFSGKGSWPKGLSSLRREALLSPQAELDPWGTRYLMEPVPPDGIQIGIKVCSNGPDKTPQTADDICVESKQ